MRPEHLAFVDELQGIAKLALTRAAKELIKGRLSGGTLGKIRGGLSAARPPEVMAEGLARGSANIAKKLNVPIYEGTLRGAAKRGVGLLKKHHAGGKVTAQEGLEAGAPLMALGGGGGGVTLPGGQGILLHKGQPLIRATTAGGKVKGLKELAGRGMSRGERKYLGEIIKRHEVDEARAMATGKSFMARKGGGWTPSWRKQKVPFMKEPVLMGGGVHADPSVLMRESRNVTFAPENVRRSMKNLRKATGEDYAMWDKARVSIGEMTPLAGSREAREATRRLSQVPQVNLVQGSTPMHITPEFRQEAVQKAQKVKGLIEKVKSLRG